MLTVVGYLPASTFWWPFPPRGLTANVVMPKLHTIRSLTEVIDVNKGLMTINMLKDASYQHPSHIQLQIAQICN